MARLAVYGYGSLVDPVSASRTLRRSCPPLVRGTLHGWRRRWSEKRDNWTCEKTFARRDDGAVPEWVMGLNVEPAADGSEAPNGVLIELSEDDLDQFDVREIRYRRVDVTEQVEAEERFDRVLTYTAKPDHFASEPPPDAMIISTYAQTVERAFESLGAGEAETYLRTTGPYPVEVVDAVLIEDHIPAGNPRDW